MWLLLQLLPDACKVLPPLPGLALLQVFVGTMDSRISAPSEKQRLQGDLRAHSSTQRGLIKRREGNFLHRQIVIR